jgi:outer membrane protein TolC
MGTPIDANIDVVPPPALPAESRDLDALFAEAVHARPDLRRADAQVRMAAAGARQASSVWWPQVAAQAGVEWNGVTFGDRAGAWVVGGELRWSVSLSGADRARIHAAASARTAAERTRDDAAAAVRVEVLSAVRQLEAAVARVSVGAESIAQAAERARVIRNRYDAGLASMTDVLAAASASLDAEARRTAAQVDALNAGAELQRALGRQVWK